MSISSRDQFLEDNPNLESIISGGSNFIDPVRLGVRTVDNGFKEVLRQIHERTPASQLNKTTNI